MNTAVRTVFYTLTLIEADTGVSGLTGSVDIDGTTYNTATTLTVQGGAEVTVNVRSASTETSERYIKFNGVVVTGAGSSNKDYYYTFVMSANTSISFKSDYGDDSWYGYAEITTS